MIKKVSKAIKNRFKDGYRYDNSQYWKEYYATKLRNKSFSREKRYANFFTELLPVGSTILDVASGYGFLPVEMAKKGFKVTCSDVFEGMMQLAKKYFKENNCLIKIVKSDAVSLPFDKGSFDMITAMSIFEHLTLSESSKYFIPSLKRIVKKGGFIMIHVPVKSLITKLKRFYRLKIRKDLPKWAIDDDGDVTHKVWFSAHDYFNILLNLGLKPKYVTYNFMRSNENIPLLKLFNMFMSRIDGKFYKIKSGIFEKIVHRFYSSIAVSCAYVCQK